ncbi:MAG TPA: kelch repeat-containing protein, partial [Anaeromyxobacteraceae bacterium]|nr:kelch repeat-containing protein [Anaeromyxobacteraceae bacterium]
MRRLVLLPAAALAALASASCSPEAGEPVVGTWTLTGAMNEPRWLHSLVSLSDGRVLAAGGCADYWEEPPPARCRALDSAEVWDPVTGIWTPTGSMNEPRAAAGAVLLGDGRVLVAGGWDGLPYSTSSTSDYTAELYDPNQGLWTRTGSMAWRRERDGASPPNIVLLPTGKVLFANGMTMDRSAVASAAEVYDPARGAWEPTGPMVVPRLASTAILLPSGKVLVVGGGTVVPPPNPVIPATARSELYDPETNAWTETKGS